MLTIAAEDWSRASIQRIKTCTITSLDFLLSILIRKLLCGPPEGIEVRGGERLAALAEGARPAQRPRGGASRGGRGGRRNRSAARGLALDGAKENMPPSSSTYQF